MKLQQSLYFPSRRRALSGFPRLHKTVSAQGPIKRVLLISVGWYACS